MDVVTIVVEFRDSDSMLFTNSGEYFFQVLADIVCEYFPPVLCCYDHMVVKVVN